MVTRKQWTIEDAHARAIELFGEIEDIVFQYRYFGFRDSIADLHHQIDERAKAGQKIYENVGLETNKKGERI